MKVYEYILFDLDGTIIDSSKGITNAVQYALNYFNIKEDNEQILQCFIGPPLKESFKKYYNFSDDYASKAVEKYREYYSIKGIKENFLYEGIKGVLEALKKNNKNLIIATSKPEKFTIEILKMHNILEYFDYISAATMDNSRVKKEDIIKYALNKLKINDVSKCIMIGDKIHDIIGANKNNMDSILATYGFTTKEEIEISNANYIVNSATQILEKLC